jgi:hypothetical protein
MPDLKIVEEGVRIWVEADVEPDTLSGLCVYNPRR